eukprot:1902062-Amphidinium_carterae.1
MNLYLYNIPDDYKTAAVQFTQQDYYFAVVHTTDDLLRQMTSDLQMTTQRNDMIGWYAGKDVDHQYQIKGERLGRESSWGKTITVGKYMDLKVVYRQQHRKAIEEKVKSKQNHFHDYNIITTNRNLDDNYAVKMTIEIYTQAAQKADENNPPHVHRFFMFLVQHYYHRVQHIFWGAGSTMEEYNKVLQHFDKRANHHFTEVNRRTLAIIRPQAPAEIQREVAQLHPERFTAEDSRSTKRTRDD